VALARRTLPPDEALVEAEVERLRAAIATSREQIRKAGEHVQADGRGPPELALIIDAHLLMVQDEALRGGAERLIRGERVNAEWAVRRVAENTRAALSQSGDDYFRERQDDVMFVAERIIRNLLGVYAEPTAGMPEGAVIVAHDLSPVDMGGLVRRPVAGVVTEVGSRTSHTTILARALGLPAVVGVGELLPHLSARAVVALDGSRGEVVIDPPLGELRGFQERARLHDDLERALDGERDRPAETIDGAPVALLANIEFPDEAATAVRCGADGIGLYRTEFLYVGRSSPPTEEEQLHVYSRIAGMMAPRPVTLRTFDLGGDKFASRPAVAAELNPALGLRALRLGLRERDVFRTQLRAMLRTGVAGNVSVMFPMVCGLGDFRAALEVVAEAREGLRRDGLPVPETLPVGCMIEVPSAVIVADLLAREAAFFSIGTNDLIQYALAIDRANEQVAHLYQPLHPAVLRLIRQAVDAARAAGIPVAMCGAMAEDPVAIPILIGMGLDRLSIAPTAIPAVRAVVRKVRRDAAAELVDGLLELHVPEDVVDRATVYALRTFPDLIGRM
jgi:phosphotransferase system enzyme I (PtsI)